MAPWIFAQLEEYHTGHMTYGNGYWGVLEALYSTAAACFFTAAFGSEKWNMQIPISVIPSLSRCLSIADVWRLLF